MAKAKKAAKAAEQVQDGVKIGRVRPAYLVVNLAKLDLGSPSALSQLTATELISKAVQHYSAAKTDQQLECETCGGVSSPDSLVFCPYCGADENGKLDPEAAGHAMVNESSAEVPKAKAPLAVVPPTPAEVKDDLVRSSSKLTERDLDDQVRKVIAAKSAAAAGYWDLGRELAIIYESEAWRLRTDEGKPRYRSWDAFVHLECQMTPPHAYSAMDVAKKFTREQAALFGSKKLSIIVRAPEEDQPALLEEAGKTGVRELAEKVKKIKKEKGHKRPSRSETGRGGARPGGGRPPREDKITIAALLHRRTVKLFKKPAERVFDWKKLERATKVTQVPIGREELENGVEQIFTLVASESGELQLIVERRRVTEA
jgi:hypothetical protein